MKYIDVTSMPDIVNVQGAGTWTTLTKRGNTFGGAGFVVKLAKTETSLDISLLGQGDISRVTLCWKKEIGSGALILGDHWERTYGDMDWAGIVPDKDLPWYFLYSNRKLTHGAGVMTGPNAFCHWRVDARCITLVLDVRNGGSDMRFAKRTLELARIVSRKGQSGENAFAAAKAFCTMMCPNPILPEAPVYGANNWYYCYGESSEAEVLADCKLLADTTKEIKNRPFMVIDMNWHTPYGDWNKIPRTPWAEENPDFPNMSGLAEKMKKMKIRPGLWFRPLITSCKVPKNLYLKAGRKIAQGSAEGLMLDPSIPEVLDLIKGYMKDFKDWGYELVKYDFTSFDILDRWGFQKPGFTADGWHFKDRSKTTAEIVLDLYRAIKDSAGDMLLIGCNTFSHLAAGLVHIQRIGDDVSGKEWERTRKMGVNTLAFRLPQHNTFYAADADCVAITNKASWEHTCLWMELVAESGTPFFVSADPKAMNAAKSKVIAQAYRTFDKSGEIEPLDWQDTATPSVWRFGDVTREFDWNDYSQFTYHGL